MTTYEIIVEELQDRVNSGILTLEDAEIINDRAYEKYVLEASKEEADTYAKQGKNARYEKLRDRLGDPNEGDNRAKWGKYNIEPKGTPEQIRKKNIRKSAGNNDARKAMDDLQHNRSINRKDPSAYSKSRYMKYENKDKKVSSGTRVGLQNTVNNLDIINDNMHKKGYLTDSEYNRNTDKIDKTWDNNIKNKKKRLESMKKESVDDIKLSIYEAYESGLIDEYEKLDMLSELY